MCVVDGNEFVNAFGGEANKCVFVEYLANRMTAEPRADEEELAVVVPILRILAREDAALGPLLKPSVLRVAIEMGGLSSPAISTQMEAVKLCVNILHHADESLRRVALGDSEPPDAAPKIRFLTFYESRLIPDVEALRFELPFYVSRMLFYCTINAPNALMLVAESPGIISSVIRIVDKSVTCSAGSDDVSYLSNFLIDCLKSLYSFSAHISDESVRFDSVYTLDLKRMMLNLMTTFDNPSIHGPIWKHTTHLLINSSDDFLVDFLTAPPLDSSMNGDVEHEVIVPPSRMPDKKLILELLVYSLTLESDDALHFELTPLLVIFTRAAKRSDPIKHLMKAWILEDGGDAPEFVQEQVNIAVQDRLRRHLEQQEGSTNEIRMPTLKQVMLPLMCHYIYALKSMMGELFWVLCDEDTDSFIEAVGVEYAAGHLVEKGLLRPSDFANM